MEFVQYVEAEIPFYKEQLTMEELASLKEKYEIYCEKWEYEKYVLKDIAWYQPSDTPAHKYIEWEYKYAKRQTQIASDALFVECRYLKEKDISDRKNKNL